MVSYKELGLVNSVKLFADANQHGYAIPAYNFNNMEQLQAIVMGCAQS
ncbi:class II fructose-bisphosphate aldolase, partial [Myxococcota bacterium]|nr:class II fructose-bisphosphate aldolase [Myxococcota bacterium]MBU1510066.1 class II fructose-bisphosphate aldolase [Myxococcota bacterium]